MLREFAQLKQESAPGKRRWFESDGFDLIVWLDAADAISGFQICYDFGSGDHAFTWREGAGWSHDLIDTGDASPLKNQTPILLPDGAVPWLDLRRVFEQRAATLEPRLRDFVRQRLGAVS